jgi:hypothetical protein
MVALSIQQPWSTVGTQLADCDTEGIFSRYVWGTKLGTFQWAEDETRMLRMFDLVDRAIARGRVDRAHWLLLKVPGLGLPKSGFVLQLVWGRSGCIDTVNLQRFGLKRWAVDIKKTAKPETVTKHIRRYLALVEQCGGTALLWDEWCATIAQRDASFEDAEDVSFRHLAYLEGTWQPAIEADLPH